MREIDFKEQTMCFYITGKMCP